MNVPSQPAPVTIDIRGARRFLLCSLPSGPDPAEAVMYYLHRVGSIQFDPLNIARFEPGRAPQKGALIIKNWWWEAEVKCDTQLEAALQHCFSRFCSFLGTEAIELPDQAASAAPFLSQLPSQL
jgi:hypothetical protein